MRYWVQNYLYGLGLREKLMLLIIVFLSFFVLENAYIIRRDYVILSNYNEDNQNYSKISELKNTLAGNNAFLNDFFNEEVLETSEGFNQSTLETLNGFNDTGYEAFEIIHVLENSVKSMNELLWIQAIANACDNYREEANKSIREQNNGIIVNQDQVNKMYRYINLYIDEFLAGTSETREDGVKDLFEEWKRSKNITIILLIVMIIMIYTGGSIFTGYITNNIKRIINLHEKVGTGDFVDIIMEENHDDEVGQLNQSFHDMQNNIKKHIDSLNEKAVMQQKLYEKELLNIEMQKSLNETKYAMLQSQINPHFLFNTLNIISRKAMFKDSDEAVKLIKALSDLFRHSLVDVSKKVSLQQELDIINDYIYIQKARFGPRLNVEIINGLTNGDMIMVPPLILQPIVENAIIHGIEPLEEDGLLRIMVTESDDYVMVVIEDNGNGFVEDKVNKDSIGLKNVMQRMEYFCSKDCFSIHSDENGTKVNLMFPKV